MTKEFNLSEKIKRNHFINVFDIQEFIENIKEILIQERGETGNNAEKDFVDEMLPRISEKFNKLIGDKFQ